MPWINILKTTMASLCLLSLTVVSVLAKTPKEVDDLLREAWNETDCKQAALLMNELQSTSSPDLYLSYQGEALEYGYCVERDIDKAIETYKKAYGISQKRVQSQIATLYLNEKNDPETAQKWFRTLAFTYAPSPDAKPENVASLKRFIKDLYNQHLRDRREFPEKEFNQALDWATELLGGAPDKAFEFALIYEKGTNGYPINKNAVDRLLHEAVMKDYPPAAWYFSQQLLETKGESEKNLYRVLNPLEKAALGGILEAQVKLAKTYQKLERYSQSYAWWLFARKNGAHVDEEISQLSKQLEPSKVKYLHRKIEVRGKLP